MFETAIHSTFVSQVVPVGFADAAEVTDDLVGTEIRTGRARLEIHARIGEGLAGAVWCSGVLRTGSALLPTVKVDVVVSPWSAGRSEVGIRPLGRLGRPDSMRSDRFFDAAWAVMPVLADRIEAARPVALPAPAEVGVAA